MTLRIIPAHLAQSLSQEATFNEPCGARYRFPGDHRPALCRLTVGDHIAREFHEDTTGTRMWKRNGYDVDGMMKPGSPPLGAETLGDNEPASV